MTILHLTTFLQGGAGRVITDLATAQQDSGHQVAVVASRTGPAGYGNYDRYLEALAERRVGVHLVDSTFAREYVANLQVLRLLNHLYPDGAVPEVVHAHAAIPALVALLFAGCRRTAMAVIQTMHGWGVSKTPGQAETDVAVMNLLDRVAVTSRHSHGLLRERGVDEHRLVVVPNGVGERSCDLYARDRELIDRIGAARAAGRFVVACVGTIGERKNQSLIVEALRRIPDAAVCGVFVGDGDASILQASIDAAGLVERCWIHGYSSAARRIAAACDALVLPSRSEGQPLAVLEAFADRLIVVCSDIPELSELVQDGDTGRLFAVDDADALATTLQRLVRLAPAQRDAIRLCARAAYERGFSARAMVEGYGALYEAAPRTGRRAA